MSDQSTSTAVVTPVPWIVWRELTYVMGTGARVPHACVRGWSTTEALGRELLEQLEDAQPEHLYVLGTSDDWADELRAVRELLEAGSPSMAELRVALAEWCCPACDVPALVMCARRLVPRVAPDMDYCFRCVRYSVPCDGHCDCASSVAFCEQWKAEHAQR